MDQRTFVCIALQTTQRVINLADQAQSWQVNIDYRRGFTAGLQAALQMLEQVAESEEMSAIAVGLFMSAQQQLETRLEVFRSEGYVLLTEETP